MLNIQASTRLKASKTPITASFDPQRLVRDGADPKLVKLLQGLASHVDIKYAQYEEGAGSLEAYIYPNSDSEIGYGEKMFSFPEISEIAKAMGHVNSVNSEAITELFLQNDGPSRPYLNLLICVPV